MNTVASLPANVMRSALEEIASYEGHPGTPIHTITRMRGLARAALQHPAAPSVSPAVEGGLASDALGLARQFHETYERLAPMFGYETRADTREFNPVSDNGKLMVAVCHELIRRLATPEQPGSAVRGEVVAYRWWDGRGWLYNERPPPGADRLQRLGVIAPPAPAAEQGGVFPQMSLGDDPVFPEVTP